MNSIINFFQNIFSKLDLSSIKFPRFGINSVVDIIVLAVFIYVIVLWIKETRAWSLFKGVMVLIAIALVTYLFNLYAAYWIISSTLSIGIIAAIIIFQPEARRALEKLGKSSFVFTSGGDQDAKISETTISEVVKAVFAMSKEKTGALIVIEREVPLGDLESAGVALDAIVSARLLINIFVNKTPLHDGAVIIRNNRIASAACILPLTPRTDDVADNLGTRHRAAIGVSEVSDAVVIVASEETGTVSVCRSGNIYRDLNERKALEMLSRDAKALDIRKKFWGGKNK